MDLSTPENLQVIDHLLTTTRSVRRRLDFLRPIELEVIERCLEIAMQAPTASNSQNWHFVVVTESAKKAAIAEYYRKAFRAYIAGSALGVIKAAVARKQRPRPDRGQTARVAQSANYLAQHLQEAPVFIIPCFEGRVEHDSVAEQAARYGSLLPATWSLMLALRARGLGAAWTSLHLVYEKEVAKILGIPETITQAALLPVAYFTGQDFSPAHRLAPENFIHRDTW
jgi:nitroreductase